MTASALSAGGVGVSTVRRDGKLCGMDVKLYSNAGCSLDTSSFVMNIALLHIDNCYRYCDGELMTIVSVVVAVILVVLSAAVVVVVVVVVVVIVNSMPPHVR